MKQKCILIVDDDQAILETMTLLLEIEGYSVRSVTNGSMLRRFVDKERPDVIIMDVFLPGIHGDALVNWLKSEDKYKDIPIILISASNEAKQLVRTTKANAFLDKPFDNDDLISLIKKLVD